MTDYERNADVSKTLTEQLKKGKLLEGDYFIANGDEIYPDYFDSAEGFLKTSHYGVKQVLAEVPSYEQWQHLKEYEQIVTSYSMKPIDYETACETVNKLLDEKKDLKHRNENLQLALKTYELPEIQKVLIDWRTGELDRKFNKLEAENTKLKELLKRAKEILEDHGDYMIVQEIKQALGEE